MKQYELGCLGRYNRRRNQHIIWHESCEPDKEQICDLINVKRDKWNLISLSLVWSDRKKKILSKCHSPWGCQIKAPDLERREAEVVIAAGESNFEDIWDTNNSICRKLYYLLLARTQKLDLLVSHHLPIHRCRECLDSIYHGSCWAVLCSVQSRQDSDSCNDLLTWTRYHGHSTPTSPWGRNWRKISAKSQLAKFNIFKISVVTIRILKYENVFLLQY